VPEVAAMGSATAGQIEGIPLFLIPKTIAEQIRKKQKSVFLITVRRNFMHQYTVIVETRDEYDRRMNPEVPAVLNSDRHDDVPGMVNQDAAENEGMFYRKLRTSDEVVF